MQAILHFVFEKATKNTFKYEEVPEEGKPPMVGSLYVQKWVLPGQPAKLQVTIIS